jgi:hypothetical protein
MDQARAGCRPDPSGARLPQEDPTECRPWLSSKMISFQLWFSRQFHQSPFACCRNPIQGGRSAPPWLPSQNRGRFRSRSHRWGYATIQMEQAVAMTSFSAAFSCVTLSQCRGERGNTVDLNRNLQQSAMVVVPSINRRHMSSHCCPFIWC